MLQADIEFAFTEDAHNADLMQCGLEKEYTEKGISIVKQYSTLPVNENTLFSCHQDMEIKKPFYPKKPKGRNGLKRKNKKTVLRKTFSKLINHNQIWLKLLKTLIKVERTNTETCQTEVQYYVSNQKMDPEEAEFLIRSHWHIENKLHLVLDKSLKQDYRRKSKYGPTLVLLDAFSFNVLQNNKEKPNQNFTDQIYQNALNTIHMMNYKGFWL